MINYVVSAVLYPSLNPSASEGSQWPKKASYNRMVNSMGFQEGDQVWLYCPTETRGKSPKLQPSWEGPYNVITWINDVVYQIQQHLKAKMIVEHLDRLAPYLETTYMGQATLRREQCHKY
jgi:hypothetical protein